MGKYSSTFTAFGPALRRATRRREWVLLALVPTFLVGIFCLPLPVRRSLTFAYNDPTLLTAYAAPFVHLRATHLVANVLGYGLVAGTGYALAALADRRRLFGVAAGTYVIAFPPVLSALNLAVPRDAVTYGFSGVVMAFAGLLSILVVAYARRRLGARITIRHAPALFLVALTLLAFIAFPRTPFALGGGTLAGLTAGRYALPLINRWQPGDAIDVLVRSRRGWVDLLVVASVLAIGYPLVAFPTTPRLAVGVVNLYSHLLGYCLAFLVPYATLEIAAIIDSESTPLGVEK